MEQYKRDFFISRIRAGYVPVKVGDKRFVIHQPNLDIALLSQEKYVEAYEKAQDYGLLADDELLEFLISQGIWSEEDEKNYTTVVPGHIEYFKIELFNAAGKSNTRKQIRKYLKTAKKEYERLGSIRHFYDYITIDGYANYVRSLYSISLCTTIDGEKVDWDKYNLNSVMNAYHRALLTSENIRELARTSPWSGLWSVLKANGQIFDSEKLTIEQQSLISWSVMYSKIYESPDCPSDDVIDDDDMLDGWLLVQKRKREAEKQRQEIEGRVSDKMKNADELYMVAETVSDAQKIDMMNPEHIKRVKKQRLKQIKEQGKVKEQEFKDVQLKRSMQMQQAFNQQVKGRQ